MAIGKWISSLKGLFDEGPLKELTEEVAEKQETKLSAENVVITDEFRKTFNVNSPVRENLRNSFLFSMLVMASHIVIADGKVEPEEYQFLGKFLRENFGEEAETEGMDVVDKIAKVKTGFAGPHQNVPEEPVVIKKIIVRRDTVHLRETVIVKDTVYETEN